MLEEGIYITVFDLSERCRTQAGKLGCFWFGLGVYFHVGSAQWNLTARP